MSPAAPFLIKLTMDDYRIWVTYHKDELVEKYGLRNDGQRMLFAAHKDIEGQNINSLNHVYSEMVTMYWVWKNNKKSAYVGFEHYRRHFDVSRLPGKGECQVYRMIDFDSQTIYQQYAQCHKAEDMDVMLRCVDKRYGDGNAYTKYIMEGHVLVANCCFLMKWADFTRLCKFLFTLLDDFAEMCGCKTVADWKKKTVTDFGTDRTDYQTRVVSFLAERLISAWISVNLSPYIGGRNVAVVNYNTPDLTNAAIRSLFKHTSGCHVYVFDNSDEKPFKTTLPNVEVIDNTKGQLVDFKAELKKYPKKWKRDVQKSNFGSAKHSMSVDKLMELIPDGFVLMDSDVLITKDIKSFWNKSVACIGAEDIKHNVPLLQPFLCYLNVPMLKENGIAYYNGKKMWALSDKDPDQYYDTGAWMLEEVRRCRLTVSYVNIWNYVKHLGHGSWKDKDTAKWLEENGYLWQ